MYLLHFLLKNYINASNRSTMNNFFKLLRFVIM